MTRKITLGQIFKKSSRSGRGRRKSAMARPNLRKVRGGSKPKEKC